MNFRFKQLLASRCYQDIYSFLDDNKENKWALPTRREIQDNFDKIKEIYEIKNSSPLGIFLIEPDPGEIQDPRLAIVCDPKGPKPIFEITSNLFIYSLIVKAPFKS